MWNIVESGIKHHTPIPEFSPNPKNVCVEWMERVNAISEWGRVLVIFTGSQLLLSSIFVDLYMY